MSKRIADIIYDGVREYFYTCVCVYECVCVRSYISVPHVSFLFVVFVGLTSAGCDNENWYFA